jgi:alkaline phosphatase D
VFQPFEVLQTIRNEAPDFFVYLGDTIYADNDSDAGNVEGVAPPESLAVYRAKYLENRADRALQHLLAAVPLYAIWDDHEVLNDFAGETVDRTLYNNGRQAFLEYMPLAVQRVPAEAPCAAAPLFRVFHWGSAVQIIVLDERSCRSADVAEVCQRDPLPTLPPDIRGQFGLLAPPPPGCLAALFDPARTMLGAFQKEQFKKALLERTATFTFVINQVPIQQFWGQPYDRWEGYAAERQHLLEFIRDHHIEHVIFLSTDTHANLINDVFVDRFAAPEPVAHEFVTGPIGHPTLGDDISALQGDAGLAGFHALLNLAGVDCRHLDVLSYGSVEVDATTGTATIMLKDDTGAVVRDQLTSVPCQKTIGPSNADQVLQHGLSEGQHASGK